MTEDMESRTGSRVTRVEGLVLSLILLGVAYRATVFSWQPTQPPIHPERASFIRSLVFDPDALVVIAAGPDAKPGIAGHDDQMNGVIDELDELGAVHSDDSLLVIKASDSLDLPEPSRVLTHGGYVQASVGDLSGRLRPQIRLGDPDDVRIWTLVGDCPARDRIPFLE